MTQTTSTQQVARHCHISSDKKTRKRKGKGSCSRRQSGEPNTQQTFDTPNTLWTTLFSHSQFVNPHTHTHICTDLCLCVLRVIIATFCYISHFVCSWSSLCAGPQKPEILQSSLRVVEWTSIWLVRNTLWKQKMLQSTNDFGLGTRSFAH